MARSNTGKNNETPSLTAQKIEERKKTARIALKPRFEVAKTIPPAPKTAPGTSAKGPLILWFDQVNIGDVDKVGGKNASLGEMYVNLTKKGVRIPNGFCVTADAYRYFVESARLIDGVREHLNGLDTTNVNDLAERGHAIRSMIRHAEMPIALKAAIEEAYGHLCKQYGPKVDVAVRSSATAEDLPNASFAGQQETFLNIKGVDELLDACRKCFASLFTNRAISYRVDKGFDHFKVALSIGVQKMVRSDLACSGVMFTIDTETGFKDSIVINGAYGLGENVVQGAVNPDEFIVFKPTLKTGFKPLLTKHLGEKAIKMIYAMEGDKPTKNVETAPEDRKHFVLNEEEALSLARWGAIIEDHYTNKKGKFCPMDIEWAKDGNTGELYIVQARPETVQSQRDMTKLETYVLKEQGKILVQGASVGDKIGVGEANIIKNAKDIDKFRKGQVLVTDMTDPDWEPIMKIAAAIVTNRGGRTCFGGDTKVLTNKGFLRMSALYENYEGLLVPSLNRQTLKVEWKPVIAAMKRRAPAIEISTSQTGKVKDNTLRVTADHHMLTYIGRELVEKEMGKILADEQCLLVADRLPKPTSTTMREENLAYLLGAIWTDGSISMNQKGTKGEVTFIQKKTPEKIDFINAVTASMQSTFGKTFHEHEKKQSSGMIRGSPAIGNAHSYRAYGKMLAQEIELECESITETLLEADETFCYSFLAGVIDGDGAAHQNARRISVYISDETLLQGVVVACMRIGTVPQITKNRNIHHVQIVEKLDEINKHTKRVKAMTGERKFGTRFFAASQVAPDLLNERWIGGALRPMIEKNLLMDAEKIKTQLMPSCAPDVRDSIKRLMDSDTRMIRAVQTAEPTETEVYNITVADNHNYLVFTEKYTPLLVNNCHAAIISRELGIPCVVGTNNGTELIPPGTTVTVSCAEGEHGRVYQGKLKYEVEKIDLSSMPKTRTKIMVNCGNPEQAFELSFLPNSGVGLAREEFIINSYIKIHPKALINYDKITDEDAKKKIDELTYGYIDKKQFYIDQLSRGVATIAAAFYPKPVIVRLADFKSNEYANLIGGKQFEPKEENPMIGWRGASRFYSDQYKEAFALECVALKKVRDEMGLTNMKIMVPVCRTVEEGKRVLAEMEKNGLRRGQNGLEVFVMCEIPSNAILAEQFCEIFDGFSIGSNDLTQMTLGVDRDSNLVAHIFDERNDAVKWLIKHAITVARSKKRKIGICGDAPSTYPEFADFLVDCGIDSISLSPDAVIRTTLSVARHEEKTSGGGTIEHEPFDL